MSADDLPLPPEGLTYYQLLGVSEEASEKDIQNAYRQLIKAYHPDQWDHWAANDVSRRLRTAYEVLTDPQERQQYNENGHEMYVGEEPASYADVEDWIGDVNSIVDVESPASLDEVEQGDEGTINVDDDFETSDESMTAEELFEEMDIDISPTSFDDVQEETRQEEREGEDPSYAEETSVENITRDDPDDEDDGDDFKPVDKTYEEQVKERAERSGRARDPSKFASSQRRRGEEERNSNAPVERGESSPPLKDRVAAYPRGFAAWVNSYLSDDVVSRAVRTAWVTRLGIAFGLFALVVGLGEVVARLDIGAASMVPGVSDVTSGAGVGLVAALIAVVFVLDQAKTEMDTSRGAINVAERPGIRDALYVSLNAIGLTIFAYAAHRGHDALSVVAGLAEGDLKPDIWVSDPSANAVIAVLMIVALTVGYLLGAWAVTRYVWYYRYAVGHRVLPVGWDAALAVPFVIGTWVAFTGLESVPIPETVGQPVYESAPEIMTTIGVEASAVTMPIAVVLAFVIPVFLGVLLFVRVKVESGVRYLLDS